MPRAKEPTQYQCRHIKPDGHRCGSPALRREHFCYFHHAGRRCGPRQPQVNTAIARKTSTFQLPSPADLSEPAGVGLAVGQILHKIANAEIDPRRAGLLLYGLQIASMNLKGKHGKSAAESDWVEEVSLDPDHGPLAPKTEFDECANVSGRGHVERLVERLERETEEEERKKERKRRAQQRRDCRAELRRTREASGEALAANVVTPAGDGGPLASNEGALPADGGILTSLEAAASDDAHRETRPRTSAQHPQPSPARPTGMRSPNVLALLALSLSLPALAQRGGGMHVGGFSGGGLRSGGFSGGGIASGPRTGGFASGPRSGAFGTGVRSSGPGTSGFAPRAVGGRGYAGGPYARFGGGVRPGYAGVPSGARPAFYNRSGGFFTGANHLPGDLGYRRYRYGYGYPGFLNYGFGFGLPLYGNFLDFDDDPVWGDNYGPTPGAPLAGNGGYAPPYGAANPESSESPTSPASPEVAPPASPNAYTAQPYDAQPYAAQPYGAQPYPQAAQPPYMLCPAPAAYAGNEPAPESLTTLVFKDGRPPIQVGNYALTRTALFITGPQTYEIPVDQLDLPATVRVNQAAGISFQLP